MRYQSYESPITLLDILSSIFRYKWRAILVSVLMFVLVIAGIILYPKRYQSEAKLFVRLGRGSASMDPATVGQTIAIQESRETEMNSIIDLLESRTLAQRVVDDIGSERILRKYAWLERNLEAVSDTISGLTGPFVSQVDGETNMPEIRPAPASDALGLDASSDGEASSEQVTGPGQVAADSEVEAETMAQPADAVDFDAEMRKRYELAINEVGENLRIESPKRSTTISVEYRAREPRLAQLVVESVIRNYRNMHIAAYQSQGALEFFDNQFDQQQELVAASEDELRQTKNENDIVTVRGKQEELQTALTDVRKMQIATDAELDAMLARVSELKASMQNLKGEIVSQRTSGIASNASDSMRNRLYELEIQEKELASKYVSTDPRLQRVREQLRDARQIASEQPKEREQSVLAINPVRQKLENEALTAQSSVAALRAKQAALEKQRDGLLSQLASLNQLEVDSQDLERQITVARDNYMRYASKLEESRINAALDENALSNVSVVGAPTIRYRHVSPRRSLLALVGACFSVVCGAMVAILSDYGRNARELSVIRRAEREAYLRRLQDSRDILEHPEALESRQQRLGTAHTETAPTEPRLDERAADTPDNSSDDDQDGADALLKAK